MPSFSDSPHVEVVVPEETRLPCGQQKDAIVTATTELCYQLAGYVAENMLNEGEFRDIAGSSDLDLCKGKARELALATGSGASRIIAASYLVVQHQLGMAHRAVDAVAKLLTSVGYVSSKEFAKLTKALRPCNFNGMVMHVVGHHILDYEIDQVIERRLS